MPVTTCEAIREGSAPLLPARATTSINAYFDRIMNTADVSATMQCVRMPASFCCFVRSRPTMAPRIAARTIRMRNSRLSKTVRSDSGRYTDNPVSMGDFLLGYNVTAARAAGFYWEILPHSTPPVKKKISKCSKCLISSHFCNISGTFWRYKQKYWQELVMFCKNKRLPDRLARQ